MRGDRSSKRSIEGFTLLELIVGLSISAIALAAVLGLFIGTQGKHYATREAVDEIGNVRIALSLMASEIRSAGSDAVERDVAGDGILVAASDTLSLLSDLDGDEIIEFTEPPEMVRYVYDADAAELTRDTGDGAVPLVQEVRLCTFSYRDAQGNPVVPGQDGATTRDVRSVHVRITIERGDGIDESRQSTFTLRNR